MLHARVTHAPSSSLRLTRTEHSRWELATRTCRSFKNLCWYYTWNPRLWLPPPNHSPILKLRVADWSAWQRPDQTREPPHARKVLLFSEYCWKLLEQGVPAEAWTGTTALPVGFSCNYNRIIWNNKGSVNLFILLEKVLVVVQWQIRAKCSFCNDGFKARKYSWCTRLLPLGLVWICEHSDLRLTEQLLYLEIMALTWNENLANAFWEMLERVCTRCTKWSFGSWQR